MGTGDGLAVVVDGGLGEVKKYYLALSSSLADNKLIISHELEHPALCTAGEYEHDVEVLPKDCEDLPLAGF